MPVRKNYRPLIGAVVHARIYFNKEELLWSKNQPTASALNIRKITSEHRALRSKKRVRRHPYEQIRP